MEITAPRVQAAAQPAERDMFTVHSRRFWWLSLVAIVVSYIHQATSLLLFSGDYWFDWIAGLGMTAIVDVGLWMLSEYLYEATQAKRRRGWATLAFLIALAVSVGLNYVYLWTNRPPPQTLDEWSSWIIASVFALFIPLLIGVAGLIRADLARWRGESAAEQASAAQLRKEARQAHGQVAELARQLEQTRAELAEAHARATAAHGTGTEEARQAHARATEAHGRATVAEQQATAAARRATVAEQQATELARELERAHAAATALPTRATVAARLRAAIDGGATVAWLAKETGWKESTLRDMVAAA